MSHGFKASLIILLLTSQAPVLAMPTWLSDQVKQGNLTHAEAKLLNEGIQLNQRSSARYVNFPESRNSYNPSRVNPLLDVYIGQLQAPGMTPQEINRLSQQASDLLRDAPAEKLEQYQQVLTLALNQARANQFTQQQDQDSRQREIRQQQILAQESAIRNTPYLGSYSSYGRYRGSRPTYPFSNNTPILPINPPSPFYPMIPTTPRFLGVR